MTRRKSVCFENVLSAGSLLTSKRTMNHCITPSNFLFTHHVQLCLHKRPRVGRATMRTNSCAFRNSSIAFVTNDINGQFRKWWHPHADNAWSGSKRKIISVNHCKLASEWREQKNSTAHQEFPTRLDWRRLAAASGSWCCFDRSCHNSSFDCGWTFEKHCVSFTASVRVYWTLKQCVLKC